MLRQLLRLLYRLVTVVAHQEPPGGNGDHLPTTVLGFDRFYLAALLNRLRGMAGLKPEDVQFAEVHDCFCIAEIGCIEALGIVEKGKGGEAARTGETALGGRLQVLGAVLPEVGAEVQTVPTVVVEVDVELELLHDPGGDAEAAGDADASVLVGSDEADFLDAELGARFYPVYMLGIGLGYRIIEVDGIIDNVVMDLDFKGFFGSVVLRF